jgi:hypothetical protein
MSNVYYSLGSGDFVQNWTDTGAIHTNDDWSGIPSIVGYRTGDATSATGVDARTITTDAGFVQSVFANQAPTSSSGGVLEVDRLTGGGAFNPTIALQGSNNNDYAAIVLHLDASGRQNVTFNATIRDLDASADNAAQQIVVQYRIGSSGEWTNVYYNADVTIAGATQAIPITVALPAEVNNQSQVQVRILTTNAAGNDELVGIDDILVTSTKGDDPIPDRPGEFSIGDATVIEGNAGTTAITFTVTRGQDSNVAASVDYSISLPGGATGASASDFAAPMLAGTLTFAAGEFSKTITLNVNGDLVNEANETFTVTLANATNGALVADGSATGTITNDDAAIAPGVPFINEIHYDNAGTDVGRGDRDRRSGRHQSRRLVACPLFGQHRRYPGHRLQHQGAVRHRSRPGRRLRDDQLHLPVQRPPERCTGRRRARQSAGQVVQFLSYEGAFVAKDGPAAGMTAVDIGVEEGSSTPAGFSLQLTGSGASAADFTWVSARDDNFGAVNSDQDFIGRTAPAAWPSGDASVVEGDAGTTMLVFTVTRAGGLGQSAGVDWMLGLPAGGADRRTSRPASRSRARSSFGVGVSSVQIAIAVNGDTVGEANEKLPSSRQPDRQHRDHRCVGNGHDPQRRSDRRHLRDPGRRPPLGLCGPAGRHHRHRHGGRRQRLLPPGPERRRQCGDLRRDLRLHPHSAAVAVGDGIAVRGRVAEFLPGNRSASPSPRSNPTVT